MYKLDLEKPEEPEIKLPTSAGSQKKRGNSRKTSTSASITTLKPLTVSITKKQDKIKKEMGLSDHRTCLLRNLCLVAVVPYSLQPHGLYSPPDSSVHGIFQARILEWVAISYSIYNPTDVGNLISGSSVFSESSLNLWNFTVHVLLKPGLENCEHYFDSIVR